MKKRKPLKQMVSPQEVLLDVQLNYKKTTILIISQISYPRYIEGYESKEQEGAAAVPDCYIK